MKKHSNNIFASKNSNSKRIDTLIFWCFRILAYSIIFCASFIFLKITVEGLKTVIIPEAPFINIKFFTEPPQTLHVYVPVDLNIQKSQLSAKKVALRNEITALAKSDPERISVLREEIATISDEYDRLMEEIKSQKRMYSDDKLRALETPPDSSEYLHETYAYSGGGIMPAIVGTVLLVTGSVTIALFLGIMTAIFLSEYSKPGTVLNLIRLSILNLAGVPSIVFGLFGFGLFVLFLDWGVSLLAGCFTLAFMALPLVISASEESLKAIPQGFREASLALGATKWKTIRTNVIPYALPGIMTSSIMAIARVAGETAPIMFTAAYALRSELPWQSTREVDGFFSFFGAIGDFFMQGVMALPYHIYVVSSKIPQNEYTERMQYGAAFVFMVIVVALALVSIFLRIRLRKKYQW